MIIAMAQTAQVQALLSIEDLEMMPDDGLHRELIEGELIELPPHEFRHMLVSRRIFRILDAFVSSQGLGLVLFETGHLVRTDRRTWIQPDVSFVRRGRYDLKEPAKYATGAPDLAIEVICPSETIRSVDRKTSLLLFAGTQEVWKSTPTQTVQVHSSENAVRVLHAEDEITSSVFPGWSARVSSLFQIEEEE